MNKDFAKRIKKMIHQASFGSDDIGEINKRLLKVMRYIDAYADGVLKN